MKAALALAAMLVSAAACTDEPKKSDTPTAPTAVSTPAQPPARRVGTVCLSYGRDRELVRSELKRTPGNEALQGKLKALDELILDAC